MDTSGERMLHSDAFAWYMEKDPVLRSTVVAVARLDQAPDWEQVRSRVDRLTRLVPKLRMRVQAPPLRVGPPQWTIDDSFDLDFHLRRVRLPDPSGWAEVMEFARNEAMDDFDRARPLWVFTLLEGMSDGGAALVTKLHHALTDGIGGVQLAGLVLDPSPEPLELGPMPPEPQGRDLSTIELTARAVGGDLAEVSNAARRIVGSAPSNALQAARSPLAAARAAVDTAVSVGRIVLPVNRQASTILGTRRTRRFLATMDVPFAELHTAAALGGGQLNDAYLAALIGGMYRYHRRHGASLPELRITVPVSIRTGNDPIGGNRITLVRIKFPSSISEPGERIRRISQIMRRWRREPALEHTQEIAFGLNLLPRPYLGGIFKRMELLASDVPGVPRPMWLAGARLRGYYGFGPTIGAGFNSTLMSYAGVCNIGTNIDTGAIEDPEVLLECLREGFAEVLDFASSQTASPAARRHPRERPPTRAARNGGQARRTSARDVTATSRAERRAAESS